MYIVSYITHFTVNLYNRKSLLLVHYLLRLDAAPLATRNIVFKSIERAQRNSLKSSQD